MPERVIPDAPAEEGRYHVFFNVILVGFYSQAHVPLPLYNLIGSQVVKIPDNTSFQNREYKQITGYDKETDDDESLEVYLKKNPIIRNTILNSC